MSESRRQPWSTSRDLPDYHAVLVVDAKDFTGNPGILHAEIAEEIPELLGLAFERAELARVWEERRFPASTGDGYAVGLAPRTLPYLVYPLLDHLQAVLKERNQHASRYDALIRLRASLHVGPLPVGPAKSVRDGNGPARNETHRLLDSVPVKAMLAAASPHVTHVAAIISDRVFEDVVEAGYAGRHPDRFIPVTATVPGKAFTKPAWLYVPEPSGNLFDPAVLGREAVGEVQQQATDGGPTAGRAPAASSVRMRVDNNSGQVAGTVHGDLRMGRDG